MQGRVLLRLVILKLGLALALGTFAQAQGTASKVQVVFLQSPELPGPIQHPPDVPRYKQIQLWSTANGGISWERVAVTSPDKTFFNFSAKADGEYWFMVRDGRHQGRRSPRTTPTLSRT